MVLCACATPPEVERAGLDPAPVAALSARLDEPDDVQACGECHSAIVAEWDESQHRSSWVDPVFIASYAVDRQPECRHCHAPLSPAEDPPPTSIAARNGIGCRTCHARTGEIAGPPGHRAHGGPVDSAWGRSAACDGCHEFTFFPGNDDRAHVFDPREPMQRTMSEHAESGSARTCQDCHMPWVRNDDGGRHRSHRMLGIHDAAFLASAVEVELRATPPDPSAQGTMVEVEVHADALGHAFPTGDMFRLAELRVWPQGEPEQAQVLTMHREFGPVLRRDEEGTPRLMLAEVADTRPRPGRPLRARLRFAGRPRGLQWSLIHLRMPLAQAERQGVPAEALDREVLSGRLALEPRAGDETARVR